ncbi:MAG: V-type ATP synthase subunit I [Oscillospiraceae bacterium]|nr:V-type ATP synthase subunit I [Oscillospiraceae bacterium]
MAIEKMKKLRLMAVRGQKEELLRELLLLGCVEVSEPESDALEPEVRDHLSKEGSELLRYRGEHSRLVQAVELLGKYAPAKKPLLSAKPETDSDAILDDSTLPQMLETADEIIGRDERIRRITAEESRMRGQIESLSPWLELDYPLACPGTEKCSVVLGGIPAAIDIGSAEAALNDAVEEAALVRVDSDKDQHYLALIALKEELPAALDSLREFGFAIASFSGMDGTAKECTERLNGELKRLAGEKEAAAKEIWDQRVHREELELSADRLNAKIACAEAEDRMYGMDSTIVLQGWALAKKVPELEKCLEKYDCAWELSDPDPEEYPDVPVKLTNNKITNGLNMVTNMYSLPAYDGVDPNPLMAPFFILFYGLMMADMGYGLLMIIAAVVAMKKIKPRAGTLSFCQLLLWGGISTFVMGFLTGGFFGDALAQIGKILGKPDGWGELWCLFNPMNDSMMVLIGAMVLGLIHLNTGMVISVVEKVKKGDAESAIWEEGSLWVILIGIIFMVLDIGSIAGVPLVLVLGCLMLFYGGSREAKGFGKVTSVFSTLYNTLTGWFGDILSYSRIMALMLAGSVIATVFNTIGGIANNLVLFIIVFIIGHALNFALNLLGCYVHDLRLQCLEYFGKFYKDGGKAFDPLAINTKYYDITE